MIGLYIPLNIFNDWSTSIGFGYFQSLESFQDSDYDKFSLLYRLLQKVDKLEICSKYFTNYVKVNLRQ